MIEVDFDPTAPAELEAEMPPGYELDPSATSSDRGYWARRIIDGHRLWVPHEIRVPSIWDTLR